MKLDSSTTTSWMYCSPSFEFIKQIPLLINFSPWGGHSFFAYDLVANTKPKTIVELGTFKGNSLFAFAQAVKDFNLKTQINAVDTWEGDKHSGFYKNDVYNLFKRVKDRYYKDLNIIEHKMLFDDAVKNFKDSSIDILHIDGLHTYEAVKHDFETWLPKVKQKSGFILFHDICVKRDDFGVYRLWNELKNRYSNIEIREYHGLGVLSLGKTFNKDMKNHLEKYYNTIEENVLLRDKNVLLRDESVLLRDELTKVQGEINLIKGENENICNINISLNKKIDEMKNEIEEFRSFKKGKIWKWLGKFRVFRDSIKNFIKISPK